MTEQNQYFSDEYPRHYSGTADFISIRIDYALVYAESFLYLFQQNLLVVPYARLLVIYHSEMQL